MLPPAIAGSYASARYRGLTRTNLQTRNNCYRGLDCIICVICENLWPMLQFLNISNIALIDDMQVEFESGLNLLTGETGSGKSIIVDALGVLIGGRFTSELLKSGSERGAIEGLFSVTPNAELDRKSTRLNSSHSQISYAVFCLKKKKRKINKEKLT